MADKTCAHIKSITNVKKARRFECDECVKIGGTWVHLRMCQVCGKIGCCDNSPNRHATAHNAETKHPIIRSAEPGEEWSWCYEDELMFRLKPS